MIPTITKEIKTYFITQTIGYNLVAFLINKPTLGVTTSPTNDELLLRENLSMTTAVAQEINSTGYKRALIQIDSTNIVYSNGEATLSVTATFTAPSTNALGPFTHVVWARGANLTGANSGNGNNRGNTTGTVYKVETVNLAPLTLQAGATFSTTTDISISI
jgi:hypothetical protein